MQIIRGIVKKALKVVVYGPEGIGKTTFASQFPDPVFIDTENSTEFLDVARFPKPSSWTMLLDEVKEAKNMAGQFKTLVVDTADWAEAMCKEHVIHKNNVTGIEDFGYGKGYTYVTEEWGKLLNALTDVRDAGINVVLTAHAYLRKFEQPDEMGSYDRWALKLLDTPKCSDSALTKEWADMILFANYETYVVKENAKDKKGKAQGGRRVMFTSHHPCWDAKNRQGLPDKLPFEFAQIAACFPDSNAVIPATAIQPTVTPQQMTAPPPQQAPVQQPPSTSGTAAPMDQTSTGYANYPPLDNVLVDNSDDPLPFDGPDPQPTSQADPIPKALFDLMRESQVSEDEVRQVIAQKGYYPPGTTWTVMNSEGFVDGWIIPFWSNIVEMIEATPGRLPY